MDTVSVVAAIGFVRRYGEMEGDCGLNEIAGNCGESRSGPSVGHRVVVPPPTGSSRPAPQKTSQNQPATTQGTMPVQRLDCVGGAARRVRTARGQQWTGLRPVAPHDLVQRTRRPAARTGCRRINAGGPQGPGCPGQDNQEEGDEPHVGAARTAPEAAVGACVAAVLLPAAVPAVLAPPCHLTSLYSDFAMILRSTRGAPASTAERGGRRGSSGPESPQREDVVRAGQKRTKWSKGMEGLAAGADLEPAPENRPPEEQRNADGRPDHSPANRVTVLRTRRSVARPDGSSAPSTGVACSRSAWGPAWSGGGTHRTAAAPHPSTPTGSSMWARTPAPCSQRTPRQVASLPGCGAACG